MLSTCKLEDDDQKAILLAGHVTICGSASSHGSFLGSQAPYIPLTSGGPSATKGLQLAAWNPSWVQRLRPFAFPIRSSAFLCTRVQHRVSKCSMRVAPPAMVIDPT